MGPTSRLNPWDWASPAAHQGHRTGNTTQRQVSSTPDCFIRLLSSAEQMVPYMGVLFFQLRMPPVFELKDLIGATARAPFHMCICSQPAHASMLKHASQGITSDSAKISLLAPRPGHVLPSATTPCRARRHCPILKPPSADNHGNILLPLETYGPFPSHHAKPRRVDVLLPPGMSPFVLGAYLYASIRSSFTKHRLTRHVVHVAGYNGVTLPLEPETERSQADHASKHEANISYQTAAGQEPQKQQQQQLQRYPVIYFHDGQNCVDPSTSFSGVMFIVAISLGWCSTI